MIERFLIEHCSATLASIKAANLCNMTFSSKEELEDQISYWSACLEPKGIHIFVLREHETRALVYVYREGLLQKELENPENAAFLKSYGYEDVYKRQDYYNVMGLPASRVYHELKNLGVLE